MRSKSRTGGSGADQGVRPTNKQIAHKWWDARLAIWG